MKSVGLSDQLTKVVVESLDQHLFDSTFDGCSNLKEIILSDSVSAFGEKCFNDCSSLTLLNIPSSLTSIRAQCFRNCKLLTRIDLPQNLHLFKEETIECYGIF